VKLDPNPNETVICIGLFKNKSVLPNSTINQPCSGNHEMLFDSGYEGYNATHVSWDTWYALFPDQTTFYFHTSIVNHCGSKIISVQRYIYLI